jgi:HAD superfamily hydrolase (TIGR01662 family)
LSETRTPSRGPAAVFFDWDGTLADTATRSRDEFAWQRQFGDTAPTLVPGAREALQKLRDAGLRVGIVTSAQRERIRAELRATGIDSLVDVVVSSDDTTQRKPAPEPMLRALAIAEVSAGEAWYIGDTPEDLQMAAAAGVLGIAVPSDYPSNSLVSRPHNECYRMCLVDIATIAASHREQCDDLLARASERLIVYGSLAPGRENHHVMSGMTGAWANVTIHGTLHDRGWGAGLGYPGITLGTGGEVDAMMFESSDLPAHWKRLDEFEGGEYVRQLAVARNDAGVRIGHIYALR